MIMYDCEGVVPSTAKAGEVPERVEGVSRVRATQKLCILHTLVRTFTGSADALHPLRLSVFSKRGATSPAFAVEELVSGV